MKGLLGVTARDFPEGKGLWIVPAEGVHTLGMRFAIDVVYLNEEGRVLKTYHRLPPYRFAAILWKARSVLELPAGVLERTGTKIGDVLEFRDDFEGAQVSTEVNTYTRARSRGR